jgi:HAD superfamily hydrolase (TIGR01509 family)
VLAQYRRVAEGDVVTEAVLFDFNGVLVDDEAQHCEALQHVLADEGITLTREQYYAQYLGLDDRTGFAEAYRRANRTLTTELMEHLVALKSQVYLQLVATSLQLVSGAREFVRDAGKRFRLGIVSGALRREIDHVLGQIGLADWFEIIIAAGDVSRCKPDPAAYLAAHQAFNKRQPIAVDGCVVIEDSFHGLEAARAAGMPCVMLTTSHSAQTLQGRGAAMVWDSLAGHAAAELANL